MFRIGRIYRHASGKRMTIVGVLETRTYGNCLIGETDEGELVPVGSTEDHYVNWREEMPIEDQVFNLRNIRRLNSLKDYERETIDIVIEGLIKQKERETKCEDI